MRYKMLSEEELIEEALNGELNPKSWTQNFWGSHEKENTTQVHIG